MNIQIGSDDSFGHIVRIAKAISTSTAIGSVEIPASGGDPKKTRCKTFTAELVDRVYVDANTRDLVPTSEEVTVVNEFPDDMPTDQELTIAELADGEWTILAGGVTGIRLYRYTLNEDWGDTTALFADADILNVDGTDTGDDNDVSNRLGEFDDQTTGDPGWCLLQDGEYIAIQGPCGSGS